MNLRRRMPKQAHSCPCHHRHTGFMPWLIGGLLLVVATTGTAVASTGTVVNIADGSNAARVAHVDAAGKLLVGDGTGNLTVDGRVGQTLPTSGVAQARLGPGSLASAPNGCSVAEFGLQSGMPLFLERIIVSFGGASV